MAFSKVLIANRGEIACRVIRTAKSLGYRTVAVYSEADANALHVQMADEAVFIGGAQAAESYLRVDTIIEACRSAGADAVHPGYGFLSENDVFAQTCMDNDIVFIGPTPDAIRLMGSKRLSKIAMIEAGVPCVPGYEGEDQSDAVFLSEATRIGFPVMVKASAGGGGRGMRLVNSADELPMALATARSEAKNAFGSGELIMEKAIIAPRHVETQVFGDGKGHCIYLGERDCSIQRRHQKVIEEAPCPVMTPQLRRSMGEAAVAAAKTVDYIGAGTVEFLLDVQGGFYFLEMNTRLQVEHPVTELVTGQDLVEWQLRVANGEPLPLTQDEVTMTGVAIEARLYAENPANNFLPQTGSVLYWQPSNLDNVRTDHGMYNGAEVSPYYDPMVAKVIAYGKTRMDAARLLARALEDTVLLGVNSNKQFLVNLLNNPVFLSGDTSTAFIEQHFKDDSSLKSYELDGQSLAIASAIMCRTPDNQGNGGQKLERFTTGLTAIKPLKIQFGDRTITVAVTTLGDTLTLTYVDTIKGDDQTLNATSNSYTIRVVSIDQHTLCYEFENVLQRVAYCQIGDTLYLNRGNGNLVLTNVTHAHAELSDSEADGALRAPMAGNIVSLMANIGDKVKKGQILVVIEAMKIQQQLIATMDGVITEIAIKQGQQVKNHQLILRITNETVKSE